MGVAGCGKSSAGAAVAQLLGLPLVEGDEFHPPSNTEKMRQGIALTDVDRSEWLHALGQELQRHPTGAVLTCSALKKSYRDGLRSAAPGLRFVFLDIPPATAHARVTARAGAHLFPPSLVNSQFATLESPVQEPLVLHLDATLPLATLSAQAAQWLQAGVLPRTIPSPRSTPL
ncbi:gluconokinase [Rhodoferax aquaticus]|uniref:Gluconokinase n=2 Tax=Rhodoferax aquaticus TaxID=2527691 RepID=A0A515EVK1_9BURK|nr:gluconokinase [Rhodoferax aquaticus]